MGISFYIWLFFPCSYTWKIYAKKVLNMGTIYGFWRQLNKEQKLAKQRYIHMFYNLQFRILVSFDNHFESNAI